jgi:steroid delta-isomerase-like uncharacterized protein
MSRLEIVGYGQDRFMEAYGAVWSSGDAELLGRYFTEDAQYVESSYGNTYTGRVEIGRFSRFMHAFSDKVKIEYTSHCGTREQFALEWMWSGVATGPIRIGDKVHPATNKPYAVPGVAICRADRDGLITLHRDYYDVMTLLRQIGIA